MHLLFNIQNEKYNNDTYLKQAIPCIYTIRPESPSQKRKLKTQNNKRPEKKTQTHVSKS